MVCKIILVNKISFVNKNNFLLKLVFCFKIKFFMQIKASWLTQFFKNYIINLQKGKIMKRLKSLILCFIIAFSSLAFVACGGDDNQSEPKYKITLETSTDYILSADKTESLAFEEVVVSVQVTHTNKKLTGVKYNESDASKNSNGTFTFLMPAKDTTVSAVLEDYQEKLSDGGTVSHPFVSFANSNTKTLVKDCGEVVMNIDIESAPYMTILNKTVFSSNESVLPASAINIENKTASFSNVITGAELIVDTSKINNGSTWLVLNFVNGNTTSQRGTIVVKIVVSDSIDVEVYDETIVFDTKYIDSKYVDSKFSVSLFDLNYVNGSKVDESQVFENLQIQDNKITINMKYVKNHEYMISFGIIDDNPVNTVWFRLETTVGEGSTETGFNQFKDGKLSFAKADSSLKIFVYDN